MRKLGPHSRPNKLQIVDGRRAEGKLMARVRAELTQHLGGKPTAPQRILIDRAAALSLRLHLMDRESTRSGEMTERNGRQYLAWSNSLTRVLNQIGLAAAPAPKDPRPFWERMSPQLDLADEDVSEAAYPSEGPPRPKPIR
jgi:hypothetical protein